MKKIILSFGFVFLGYGIALAQCDKKIIFTSSKTEYLDSTGTLQRSVNEQSIIEISKTEISVVPGNPDRKLTGPVRSAECDWKVPYKEGKSLVKATLSNTDGETREIMITIDGKDGVVTLTALLDNDQNRRIRLKADSFEEKK